MRDLGVSTDLRLIAQDTAARLETALQGWLGRDTGPQSVASYVAHSADHPWGRPRVVLGLDADQALALAELLNAHPAGDEDGRRSASRGGDGDAGH